MKSSLLKYIVCPFCRKEFHLRKADGNSSQEILRGQLVCSANPKHLYSVRDGVPEILSPETWSKEKRQTEKSFSAKWRRVTRYREVTGRFYMDWYFQRYGFQGSAGLRNFLRGKQFILDAGTGTGRDAKLYSENSDAQVFGIDMSEGIFVAYRDLRRIPNLHLIRADLTRLPFRERFFDFIACDQVLHHTPNPKKSLRLLLSALKPKSPIAFYLYKKKGPIREFCDDFLRKTTTRMTEKDCRRFSEALTQLGRSLSELKVTLEIPQDIPLLDLKAGEYDLQRFFHWNFFKCFWNSSFDYETNIAVNFDWYYPPHAYRYSEQEVKSWCRDLHLKVRRFNVVESGISVLAVKPKMRCAG